MNQLKRFWHNLRTSFWFVPSLIVAGSIVLAVALVEAHTTGSAHWLARWPRLFGHVRSLDGNTALFSHGQFGSVLAARWVGLPLVDAQHFPLATASLSILGFDDHHPEVPVIARWNAAHNGCLSAST
jgi:hypothetical protein